MILSKNISFSWSNENTLQPFLAVHIMRSDIRQSGFGLQAILKLAIAFLSVSYWQYPASVQVSSSYVYYDCGIMLKF